MSGPRVGRGAFQSPGSGTEFGGFSSGSTPFSQQSPKVDCGFWGLNTKNCVVGLSSKEAETTPNIRTERIYYKELT